MAQIPFTIFVTNEIPVGVDDILQFRIRVGREFGDPICRLVFPGRRHFTGARASRTSMSVHESTCGVCKTTAAA